MQLHLSDLRAMTELEIAQWFIDDAYDAGESRGALLLDLKQLAAARCDDDLVARFRSALARAMDELLADQRALNDQVTDMLLWSDMLALAEDNAAA
jgi:hypothetical protein